MTSCARCGQHIGWIDCPTGGWWAHRDHPDDGHDAVPARRPSGLLDRVECYAEVPHEAHDWTFADDYPLMNCPGVTGSAPKRS